MLVHEFVEGNKPVMVLVHGVLTPWQIWMPQIEAFKEQYNIYAIALDAHTEEYASEFVSIEEEVEKIEQYFEDKNIGTVAALCGISLGGKIAYRIWKNGRLNVRNLILDGAPLVSCPKFAINVMTNMYKNIIHKSKLRDEKVIESFKRDFLPDKYLESYLKIADYMTDDSIKNIVHSAFKGDKFDAGYNKSRILFIHGTKGNEILSKKAAARMKKYYSDTEVICFKGDTHCYKAIYEPQNWIQVVEQFLNRA